MPLYDNSRSEPFDADESLSLARHEIESKDYARALARLKRPCAAPAAPAEAHQALARLYGSLGLPQRAQIAFEAYLALNPEARHDRFELGMTLFEQGMVAAALRQWQQVLEEHSTYPPALFYAALALWNQAQPQEARRFLQQLLTTAPADNLYHARGQSLLERIDTAASASAAH